MWESPPVFTPIDVFTCALGNAYTTLDILIRSPHAKRAGRDCTLTLCVRVSVDSRFSRLWYSPALTRLGSWRRSSPPWRHFRTSRWFWTTSRPRSRSWSSSWWSLERKLEGFFFFKVLAASNSESFVSTGGANTTPHHAHFTHTQTFSRVAQAPRTHCFLLSPFSVVVGSSCCVSLLRCCCFSVQFFCFSACVLSLRPVSHVLELLHHGSWALCGQCKTLPSLLHWLDEGRKPTRNACTSSRVVAGEHQDKDHAAGVVVLQTKARPCIRD